MPDPEHDLEIPPFPIEELLTPQDREDIKACAEDLVSSTGEEPVYLTKPQMDDRLASLRGFKGSFLETGDPLATGELEKLPTSVFVDRGEVKEEGGGVPLFEQVADVAAEAGEPEEVVVPDVADVPEPKAEVVPPPIPEVLVAAKEERPDRRVSLVFFGGGLVAMGALWALIGALIFVGIRRSGSEIGGGVVPMVWCGLWAVAYLVLGFGNVSLKRWARSLTVVAGWVWMALGVVAVVGMGLFFAELTAEVEAFGAVGSLEAGGGEDLMVGLLGGLAMMAIFVPGIMILYASAPSVKATCERWNQRAAWTDRRAPGMLVFGGLLACVAFWFGALAASDCRFLWYGKTVEGLAAQQVFAGACGASLVLAVLTLDLRRGVWWVLLFGVLAGLGLLAGPWAVLLSGMGGGDGGAGDGEFSPVKTAGLVLGIWVALLVFVLFLRRCLPGGDKPRRGRAGPVDDRAKGADGDEPVVEGA